MPGTSNKWRMGISAAAVVALAALVGVFYLSIALNTSDRQNREAINTSVCGFRALAAPQLKRAIQAAHDKKSSPGARKRAVLAVASLEVFLSTQVTSPHKFDCRKIIHPKKPLTTKGT